MNQVKPQQAPLVNPSSLLKHGSIVVQRLAEKVIDGNRSQTMGWSGKDWNGNWGGRRSVSPF